MKIPNNLKDDEDYDYMENECLIGKLTVVLQIKNQGENSRSIWYVRTSIVRRFDSGSDEYPKTKKLRG